MHLLITVVLKYFLLYPAEKDRVLDKFHETLGSAGYSFGISNLFPCGGAAVRLSIMKVKGEKQVTFKYKAKWLNFMKRILISATKDMGYMQHSAGFESSQFCYTASVSRENK